MVAKPSDMTPAVDLTHGKGTGPVRYRRPIYVDLLPPCNNACPAGENIQGVARPAQAGKYREAWEIAGTRQSDASGARPRLLSPLRGCLQSRRTGCAGKHPRRRALSGRSCCQGRLVFQRSSAHRAANEFLVIGAGPSGLSAAYHLARLGHTVEIHEAGPLPGGMMHFGIPAYRLPRRV